MDCVEPFDTSLKTIWLVEDTTKSSRDELQYCLTSLLASYSWS